MISRETIDKIFQTARVEEVIGEFVSLKKSGSNYKGLSPFTQEKSPSFMVSPAKQIWKDFSSGKGGSVVSFLMEHEQFTYPEALRWLAKRYGIEIEEEHQPDPEKIAKTKERENQFALTEFANKWFQTQLWETDEGKQIAYAYFKERGFTKESMEKFNLGYSPKDWSAFTSHAIEKGYSFEALQEVGLTVGNKEKPVDRFRERVIFPIHSFSGRTLGFGGRILGNNKKTAKYLNSPENQIYFKSKILYGIYQAKQAILREDECILVEGYTDVISLHQSGVENVVSSSGTALTADQIRLVKRLTNNLTLVYDGDPAGIKASFRGIDLILEQELNVRVVVLEEGEDPDSFAQSHKTTEIQEFFKSQAIDFIRFKVGVLKEEAGDDPVRKSQMIQSIIDSIALIPNLIQRELYVRDASGILGIGEDVLFRQLAIKLAENDKESRRKSSYTTESPLRVATKPKDEIPLDSFESIEEDLIQMMVRYGEVEIELPIDSEEQEFYKSTITDEIISQLEEDGLSFSTPHYQEMFSEIKKEMQSNESESISDYFIRHENENLSKLASGMIFEKYHLSNWDKQGVPVPKIDSNLSKRVQEMLLNYKRKVLLEMIKAEHLKTQLKDLSDEKREEVIKEIMRLTQLKKSLDELLNRAV